MTALESAYELAGEVFERQRARGETTGAAFAYASRILRHNLSANSRDAMVPSEAIALATSVARRHNITMALLRESNRFTHVVAIRCEVAWSLRQAGYSYPMIGRILRRDHSTIITAVRSFEARLAGDEILRRRMGVGIEVAA